jgi:hypothetical protein
MISVSQKNLQYPLDPTQLYWLRTSSGGIGYRPAHFYFANSDGSLLVPAMDDEARFISALQNAIAQLSGAPFAIPLQNLLDELTAAQVVAAPRYPAAGDTHVSGVCVDAVKITNYKPIPYTPPPWDLPPIWCGVVVAAIRANDYSTPPPYPPADCNIQFFFSMGRILNEVHTGDAVHFDIAQGKFSLYATNITLN